MAAAEVAALRTQVSQLEGDLASAREAADKAQQALAETKKRALDNGGLGCVGKWVVVQWQPGGCAVAAAGGWASC